MGKRLMFCVSVVFVMLLCSFTQATVIFGFNQNELAAMTKQGEQPVGQTLSYIAVNTDPVYGLMLGDVGFMGTLLDITPPLSAKILIGSESQNLTGYDEFAMTLFNDNDDIWTVGLYVDTGDSVIYSNTVTLVPGQNTNLTLDITNFGLVNSVGFTIGADRNDTFHISAQAIPEPATLSLVVLGAVALLIRKNR